MRYILKIGKETVLLHEATTSEQLGALMKLLGEADWVKMKGDSVSWDDEPLHKVSLLSFDGDIT